MPLPKICLTAKSDEESGDGDREDPDVSEGSWFSNAILEFMAWRIRACGTSADICSVFLVFSGVLRMRLRMGGVHGF